MSNDNNRRKIPSGSHLEGMRALCFSGLISELGFSDQTQDIKVEFEFQINKESFFFFKFKYVPNIPSRIF